MVILTEAKNRIRDLIGEDLSNAAHGTDGTDVLVSDEDLLSQEVSTIADVSTTVGNKTVNATHILLSTIGNGVTLREFGVYMSDGTSLNRVVYPSLEKISSIEVHTITTLRIE